MKKRVIARKRGVIPGCIPAGQDSHMAVDSLGRPWPEVAKLPSTVERLGRRTREEIQQSRNGCGRGPQTALIAAPGLAAAIRPNRFATAAQLSIISSLRLPASEDFHMTSRFPGPWRIAEFPNGFAVYDATGRQLGFFYGRTNPNTAGQTSFLMVDEARQIAVDFTRLPELLNQTSARSEVATSPEDDKLATLETNCPPQDVPETSRLPRAAQLSVITVTGSPLVKAPATIRRSIPFEPDRRRSTRMLRRPSDTLSIRTKFLIMIAIAVAALPAGYLFFGNSDPPERPQHRPQATTNRLSVEFSPLREAQAPTAVPPVEFLPLQAPTAAAVGTYAESRIEPEAQTAPSTVPVDIKPTENGIEAKLPQTLPQKEGQSFTPSQDDSTCFPSASAVRQNYPGRWPSWTLRAPGHEGTRCWYAARRATAHDHP